MKLDRFNTFNNSINESFMEEWNQFRLTDTYQKLFYQTLQLFCNDIPSKDIWEEYLGTEDGHLVIQDFINSNIKDEFSWSTGIGILEACESLIEEAYNNGNLNDNK